MNFKCSVFVVFLVCHVINGQKGPDGPKCKKGCIPDKFCTAVKCEACGKGCMVNSCTQSDACTANRGIRVPFGVCEKSGCVEDEDGCGCMVLEKPEECDKTEECKDKGGKCTPQEKCVDGECEPDLCSGDCSCMIPTLCLQSDECADDGGKCVPPKLCKKLSKKGGATCDEEKCEGDDCTCMIKQKAPKPSKKCVKVEGVCSNDCVADSATGIVCNPKWCKPDGFSCEYTQPVCEDDGCSKKLGGMCVNDCKKGDGIACSNKGCGGSGCKCKYTKVTCEKTDCDGKCVPNNKCNPEEGVITCDAAGCGDCTCKIKVADA